MTLAETVGNYSRYTNAPVSPRTREPPRSLSTSAVSTAAPIAPSTAPPRPPRKQSLTRVEKCNATHNFLGAAYKVCLYSLKRTECPVVECRGKHLGDCKKPEEVEEIRAYVYTQADKHLNKVAYKITKKAFTAKDNRSAYERFDQVSAKINNLKENGPSFVSSSLLLNSTSIDSFCRMQLDLITRGGNSSTWTRP